RDLALGFEDHFAAKVAVGHGGNDPGNAAHLVGQVAGHQVHVVGQVFPGAGHALHPGLAAQLAFGADLTRHPGDLRSKGIELVDHHVDGVLQLEDLALDLDRDLPRSVPAGDGRGDLRDIADLPRQVAGERVDVVGEILPGAGDAVNARLAAEAAFRPDFFRDAGDLGGEGVELVDHHIDGVLELENLAADVDRDLLGQVALGAGGADVGD